MLQSVVVTLFTVRAWPRAVRWAVGLTLAGFVALNGLAFFHARAMTHFAATGRRTPEAECLGFIEKIEVICRGITVPRPVNLHSPANLDLAFETVTLTGAHGLRLEAWHVRQTNALGTVLLFHGYTGSKDSLLDAGKEFAGLGYDTLLVDFYGSGGSAGSETSVGYYEAEDVAAAYRWARATAPDRPVILYGVSMGAAAVIRAVGVLGIEPEALILECPFDRLLTTVKNRFAAMRLPAFPAAQLLVFWGGVQQGFNGFGFNPAEDLRAVRCPVLLMHGGQDARVKPAEVEHLARSLNRDSVLKVFPGAPHQTYVGSRTEEWRASVLQFLQRSPALRVR